MTQFVFASWNVCVTDQAKVWSSEVEGKSLQWFFTAARMEGVPNGMEETFPMAATFPKVMPEPEEQAVTETSLCWA